MDAFEYSGYWWLPEKPDNKVPGTLKFSHADGLELRVLAPFTDLEGFTGLGHYDIVLGMIAEQKVLTLLGCDRTQASITFPGIPTERVMAQVALVGAHFATLDDVRFFRASAQYSFLPDWAGATGFKYTSKLEDENETAELRLENASFALR
jgi:ApeA N-terminal domain 1